MKFSESLKRNADFQNVYKNGKSYANRYLVMYVLENQTGRNRQYDLEPHRRRTRAFLAGICDAEYCRSRQNQRCQPGKHIFPADKIGNSSFHVFHDTNFR